MGFMIVIGGTIGTALGIYTFTYFKGIGKIDTVISLAYMYILAIIGPLMLVVMLVIGSIIGVQLGQKLGEKIDRSGLRALLAILLLVVGIAIAYDTFFAEQAQTEISSISNSDLNFFSKFIKEFSNDMPFFYGLFSIMFAIFLGVAAAFIRRFASNFKKKMLM